MRQFALVIGGTLQPDDTIQVQHFDHPIHLWEIPQIQQGFFLRNRDVAELQAVIPAFQNAMAG